MRFEIQTDSDSTESFVSFKVGGEVQISSERTVKIISEIFIGETASTFLAETSDKQSRVIKVHRYDQAKYTMATVENKVLNEVHYFAKSIGDCFQKIIKTSDTIISIIDMPHIPGENYFVWFKKFLASKPSYQDRTEAMIELAAEVERVHGLDIVHNDIKPENFVGKKLIDYEYSKSKDDPVHHQANKGTPAFVAPEVVNRDAQLARVTQASDIFSFGLIGLLTFGARKAGYSRYIKEKQGWAFNAPPDQSGLVEGKPSDAKTFLNRMVAMDPEQRPTAKETLAYFILQGMHNSAYEAEQKTTGNKRERESEPDDVTLFATRKEHRTALLEKDDQPLQELRSGSAYRVHMLQHSNLHC